MKYASLFMLLVIIVTVLLLGFGHVVYAQGVDKDPHATGLIFMTPEEREAFRKTHGRIKMVLPNEIALERINSKRDKKGLPPLSDVDVAPLGEDVISSMGEAAPAGEPFTGELPDYVDNSTLPAFPVIRSQGSLGSCTCFATTYYQHTYMAGLVYGWDNKNENNSTKFSPKWNYNMLNEGERQGTSFEENYELVGKNGAAIWAEFPYDGVDYREWCLDTQAWRNAINYRANPVEYIPVDPVDPTEDLTLIKQLLINEYIVTFGTHVNSWEYKTIEDAPGTEDNDFNDHVLQIFGKPVAYRVTGEVGGHAMTIVGYNDLIWTDINGNGTVDDGEKGALRIANSWGAGWVPDPYNNPDNTDGGFTWLAYYALKSVPEEGRFPAIRTENVFKTTVKADYAPEMVAQFTVKHRKRDQLSIRLGVSLTSAGGPTTIWESGAIAFQGGPYGFDGTKKQCNGTFVFDFTDLLPSVGELRRYYLIVEDNASGHPSDPAELYSFEIEDVYGGGNQAFYNPPETVDLGEIHLYLDHTFGPDVTPPAAVTDLATGGTTASSIVLTWTAPGDDGNTGTASQYDIRYSDSQITNDATWEAAIPCTDEPSPSPVGTTETFTVTGLSSSMTCYFALKTADEVPNWSELSNIVNGTTKEGGIQEMQIASVEVQCKNKGPWIYAEATVKIVDSADSVTPIEGAEVTGEWSYATTGSDSGLTDGSGLVTFESGKIKYEDTPLTFTFIVTNVSKTDWDWDGIQKEGSDTWPPGSAPARAYITALGNVYPCPGNPSIWIPFTLSGSEHVVIRIYDAVGRLVRTLDLGPKAPGAYMSKDKAAYWDGRNEAGERVTSGIYFYTMSAGEYTAARKLAIRK